jgi:hypothetical protein
MSVLPSNFAGVPPRKPGGARASLPNQISATGASTSAGLLPRCVPLPSAEAVPNGKPHPPRLQTRSPSVAVQVVKSPLCLSTQQLRARTCDGLWRAPRARVTYHNE